MRKVELSGVQLIGESWGQTIEEIFIKVNLPENTTSKQVVCKITARSIKCAVRGNVIFEVRGESVMREVLD